MIEKQFKTLEEQIEILRHKGMIINDENYTKEVLLRENYFFLNDYRHLFLKSETERVFKKAQHLKKCIVYSYLIDLLEM